MYPERNPRKSIPTEEIIRAYMDESIKHEEEVIVETIDSPEEPQPENSSEEQKQENEQPSIPRI